MFTALIPLAGLAAKFLWDHHKGTQRLVESLVRASFSRAVQAGGITDKTQAHRLFAVAFGAAAKAAGLKLSAANYARRDKVFNEIWEIHSRQVWDAAIAELKAAGKRGDKLATELLNIAPPVKVSR